MCNKFISKGILTAVAVSVILSGMVLGCKQASGGDSAPAVETITYVKTADNYYQFKTNDSQYYGFSNSVTLATPVAGDTLSIKCKKVSGYTNCGMGMVCFKKDWDNYYVVAITATGWYTVFKKIGANWISPNLVAWTQSTDIVQGLNAENTIAVNLKSGTSTTYEIRINGKLQAFTFENADLPFTGRCGFYSSIDEAKNENFPSVAEDLRFMMISPAI